MAKNSLLDNGSGGPKASVVLKGGGGGGPGRRLTVGHGRVASELNTNLKSNDEQHALSVDGDKDELPPGNARLVPGFLLDPDQDLTEPIRRQPVGPNSHTTFVPSLERFLDCEPARLGQPPGALLGQQHAQPQDGAGDELQADGDLPLRGRVVGDVLGDGVVDPVRGHDAEGEEELEHAAQHAADVLGRHLGGVHGHDDGGHADADARDDARDVKGRERVRVDGLDDGADVEDGGRQDE